MIDFGSTVTLTGFTFLPRQDGYNGVENGDLGDYELYVGNDSGALTTLSFEGTFTATDGSQSSATFTTPLTGRYLKLVAPEQRWIAIAEMTFMNQEASQSSESPSTGDSTIVIALSSIQAPALVIGLQARNSLNG